jgi:hypothetical protein
MYERNNILYHLCNEDEPNNAKLPNFRWSPAIYFLTWSNSRTM